MANAPESILALWNDIEARGCRVPQEVWSLWQPFLKRLDDIYNLVELAGLGEVPVESLKKITLAVGDLQRFVRLIRSGQESRVEGDNIFLEQDILQLIVHYIGNDLYVIALVADVPKNNPLPIPSSDAVHILERVQTIRDFLSRLKKATERP